jgi:hypothetical protein
MKKVLAPIVILLLSVGLLLFMMLPSSPDLEVAEAKAEAPSSEIGVFHPFSREDTPRGGLKFNLEGFSEHEVDELLLMFDVIYQVDKKLIENLSKYPIKADSFSSTTRVAGLADTVNDIMYITVEMIPDQVSCMSGAVHETFHLVNHEVQQLQSNHSQCEYDAWDHGLKFLNKLKEKFEDKINKDAMIGLDFNIYDCQFKRKHHELAIKILTLIESHMDAWKKALKSSSDEQASVEEQLSMHMKTTLLYIYNERLLLNAVDDQAMPQVVVFLRDPSLNISAQELETIQLLFEEWQQTRNALEEAGERRQKLIKR